MTRTVAIDTASAKAKRVYEVVLKAQRAALKKVGAGITGTELDAVARNIITKAGYGARFIHTLGHGVGRKIHQAPRISPKRGGNRLQAGDVITIEPGIYLPREFGVRIEDMVVVTKAGSENLTRTSKRFII